MQEAACVQLGLRPRALPRDVERQSFPLVFFSQAKQKTGLTLFEGHSGALTETAKPAASDTVNQAKVGASKIRQQPYTCGFVVWFCFSSFSHYIGISFNMGCCFPEVTTSSSSYLFLSNTM